MVCTWIERDEVFEGYVRDALDPEQRSAFEDHFFACEACFEKLETYRALRAELREEILEPARPRMRGSRRFWLPLAAAAGLVGVAVLTQWIRGTSTPGPQSVVTTAPTPPVPAPPSPSTPVPAAASPATSSPRPPAVPIAVLARVEPPVYLPLALRAPQDEAAERFGAAMQRYGKADYAGAIPDLRAAAALNPKAPHAAFFLGVCQLLTGELEPAVEGLQKAIALGDSPYLEEAHFYLAKARLRQGRLQNARDELTRAIERHGRLAETARQLRSQVDALLAEKGGR